MGCRQTLIDYDPENHSEDLEFVLNPESYPNLGIYDNENITPENLIDLPIHEQIKYSDAIHRRYAKNKIYQEKILKEEILISEEDANKINEITVGNTAVLVFYNPEEKVWKDRYENLKEIILES